MDGSTLVRMQQKFANRFPMSVQHCPMEFFDFLIAHVDDLNTDQDSDLSLGAHLYFGLKAQLQCECGVLSNAPLSPENTYKVHLPPNLPPTVREIELQDLLLFPPHTIEKNCDNCRGKNVRCRKTDMLATVSKYFLVHIVRHHGNEEFFNNTPVLARTSMYLNVDGAKVGLRLQSFVYFVEDSRHFVAVVKQGYTWWRYDDCEPIPSSIDDVDPVLRDTAKGIYFLLFKCTEAS